MSENSLKIRGKFINKLATKIEDLNDNFILLSQVDKKIFKKMNNQMSEKINNQRGGDSKAANNAILSALKKSQEMKAQQEKLTLSLNKLDNIQGVIKDFSTTFNNIKNIIDSITLGDLNEAKIDQINDLADSDKNTLNDLNIRDLQELLNAKKTYTSYDVFRTDETVPPNLKEKIDPSGFGILFPPAAGAAGDAAGAVDDAVDAPAAPAAPAGDQQDGF